MRRPSAASSRLDAPASASGDAVTSEKPEVIGRCRAPERDDPPTDRDDKTDISDFPEAIRRKWPDISAFPEAIRRNWPNISENPEVFHVVAADIPSGCPHTSGNSDMMRRFPARDRIGMAIRRRCRANTSVCSDMIEHRATRRRLVRTRRRRSAHDTSGNADMIRRR